MSILLVDDEVHALRGYESQLLAEGIASFVSCTNGQEALAALADPAAELMILDLRMPGMPGEEVLSGAASRRPDLPVIVVTAVNDIETAVRCMGAGAFDYLLKPVEQARLVTSVRKALEFREMRQENAALAASVQGSVLRDEGFFAPIVTRDSGMRSLFRYIESISRGSQPVLVSGETGVGKELFARAVHDSSGRGGLLVPVNVAGLDDEAFADTMFGHRRGAFTGADRDRAGLIERAENGTLFLDEIGELGERSQVKLLRLIQEREYYPLGSDSPRRSSARIVAATNRDLEGASKSGGFRPDLYYRLCLHQIRVPPLRERKSDILLLARTFLREAAEGVEAAELKLGEEQEALLLNYDFPGNVRELRSLVYDAMSRAAMGEEPFAALRVAASAGSAAAERGAEPAKESRGLEGSASGNIFSRLDSLPSLEEAEELLIEEAMRRSGGNKTLASELIGLTRQTLLRRSKRKSSEE